MRRSASMSLTDITAWMNNHIGFWDLIFIWTAIEVTSWMCKYIKQFHVDVISYPCLNPDAGLANIS